MSKYDFQSELNSEIDAKENTSMDVKNYARWYTRFAAGVIDGLICFVAIFIILLPFTVASALIFPNTESAGGALVQLILQLLGVILSFIYYGYFLSKDGATLGLKALGIKTVKEDGTYLTFGQAILRTFIFSLISIINMIMILLTEKKQGAHDMVVNAVVIKANEKETAGKVITGFCGGCGCLAILGITIAFITGSTMLFSAFNKGFPSLNQQMNKNLEKDMMKEQPKQIQNNFRDQKDSSFEGEMKEEPSLMEDRTQKNNSDNKINYDNMGSEFYKACMGANTNPDIDLSNYCSCAEKEFSKTQDLNEIVNKCKDQIILN